MKLVKDGIWKIMDGRRWVGRVYQSQKDGLWYGKIGDNHTAGATEVEAFENAAAKHYGFSSGAALRAENSVVRAENRAARQATRARAGRALDALQHGDYKAFCDFLLEGKK